MVQAILLGQPATRPVFSFGTRELDRRLLLEEVVTDLFLVVPLSLIVAHATIRFAAAGWRPKWVRSDIWTTFIITIVGDLFLEVLLPSLYCLPDPNEELDYFVWLGQSWGFGCPAELPRSRYLSPDSVGMILSLRSIFICLGVSFGEIWMPICLTGGIACGKTTVAQLLLDPLKNQRPKAAAKKGKKKSGGPPVATPPTDVVLTQFDEDEGSFLIVDTDSIGHEILLPQSTLAGETVGVNYTVSPRDSVYDLIVDEFGDPAVNNKNILDDDGLIDRRKLGAIIFSDPPRRHALNRITHPKIILVLLKRLLAGVCWTNQDVVCADVPLLFESGKLRWLFGLTLCVSCDPDTQYLRLRKRNPELTEQQCRDRIASQFPMAKKEKLADIVIWNDGDMDDLAKQVEDVRREVMGRIYGVGLSLVQILLLVGGSLSLSISSKLFSSFTSPT